MSISLLELLDKLAKCCRILYYEGATSDGYGHQCYLLGPGRILIPGHLHPSGLRLGDVQADDIVTIDFDGKVLEGRHEEPMGEFFIYPAIFKLRRDVKSIIHIHPPYLNVLACAEQDILPICVYSLPFRDGLAFYDRFPLYIGDKKHAEAAANVLGQKKVLVHRGHGAFIVGRSIEDALLTALTVESAAKVQWMASALGIVKRLPKEEMERFRGHESRDDETLAMCFLYYAKKLEKIEKWGTSLP